MIAVSGTKMDVARVDQVIQFALLEAGRQDDPFERELGPIHLIKYAYLADLAFAERHDGETFSKAPWIFYHYGPWAQEVNARIEPALGAIGSMRRVFDSPKYDADVTRWSKTDDSLYEQLEETLPSEITHAIRRAVRRYGADTNDLLRAVYATPPMLRSKPRDQLVFEGAPMVLSVTEPKPERSRKQEKRQQERLRQARASISERLKAKREERAARPVAPPPRYDDVFFDGVAWLDKLAGPPPSDDSKELSFDDSVWTSPTRGERRD